MGVTQFSWVSPMYMAGKTVIKLVFVFLLLISLLLQRRVGGGEGVSGESQLRT